MIDLFLTNMQLFTSPDVNWWTGVVWITCGLLWCFYQLFGLSFWRHPFTAEDPLLSNWCNATFLQIWWRNKLISDSMSQFSENFHFWVNYSLKDVLKVQEVKKAKQKKCQNKAPHTQKVIFAVLVSCYGSIYRPPCKKSEHLEKKYPSTTSAPWILAFRSAK